MPASKEIRWEYNDNGCWVCTSHMLNHSGYPLKMVNKKTELIHRLYYIKYYGAIPKEKPCVLHSCDNPSCINPRHLRAGTQKDNIRDMFDRHRENNPIGTDHYLAKLNPEKVKCIRESSLSSRKAAERYGVSKTVINDVRNRKTWRHVL